MAKKQVPPYERAAERIRQAGAALTAMQRESADTSLSGAVTPTQVQSAAMLPAIYGVHESMPDQQVDLRTALSGLTVQMDGEVVGRLVAATVSSEIGRAARSRRYSV